MMKYGIFAAAFLVLALCGRPALAAETPEIVLKETGARRAYQVTIENWDSGTYAAQFDLMLDRSGECAMQWADTADTSFYKLEQAKSGAGTRLTFYCDKRTPISGGRAAKIGTLTIPDGAGNTVFSTSGAMKLLDGRLSATEYQNVTVRVASYTPPALDNISTKGSSGGSGGSKGSGGSSRGGSGKGLLNRVNTTWKDVREKAPAQSGGEEPLALDMTGDTRISADVLAGIKADKRMAVLSFGAYEWVIDGATIGEIPPDREYYDLAITALALENLSAAAGGNDIVQFETAYDGPLPFTATLRWPLGAQYAGKTVWLGRYDSGTGYLESCGSAQVKEDGLVEFSFNHFSYYVISSVDLWSAAGTAQAVVVPAQKEFQTARVAQEATGEAQADQSENAAQPVQTQSSSESPAAADGQHASGAKERQTGGITALVIFIVLVGAFMAITVCAVLRKRNGR